MLIRKARQEESGMITPFLLLAMEEIVYGFIGEDSRENAIRFLDSLTREKDNQYSYKNCWVVASENKIVAAAIVYDGGKLKELREPVGRRIQQMFGRDFNPEDESQDGEYYVDCVGVDPDQQGRGIGSALLRFLIDEYVHKQNGTLGLLVDKENPGAKKLYEKLGFIIVGEKRLMGKTMEHLQFQREHEGLSRTI